MLASEMEVVTIGVCRCASVYVFFERRRALSACFFSVVKIKGIWVQTGELELISKKGCIAELVHVSGSNWAAV